MKDSTDPATAGIPPRYLSADGRIDIQAIKDGCSIAQVALQATALKRCGSGAEAKGLCPLHDENTPSFHVNDDKGAFYCFGCGAGGNAIDLYGRLHRRTFIESCVALAGGSAIRRARSRRPRSTPDHDIARKRAFAEWRRAAPISGSPAERYLVLRGVGAGVPGSLRFSHVPRFWDEEGREGPRHPAMLAAVQDQRGHVVGIHRTFIDAAGRKCQVGSSRLSLGTIRGCAIRLGPICERLMLCAGIEDGLALRLMFPGASVWIAPGDSNLPRVRLPDAVRHVIVCGDEDRSGRTAVEATQIALEMRGIATTPLFPKGAKDFNEEWLLLHA